MRRTSLLWLLSIPALAARPGSREPFANARVTMMARAQVGGAPARLAEVEIRAEGSRLRARIRGEPEAGEFWLDGLSSEAIRIVGGRIEAPPGRTLERGLQLALSAAPSPAHANTDRIAGRPCKIVSEALAAGFILTRCLWRGLPLSAELAGKGFAFNAAATLVEEGVVTVADLQPPTGAPPAPPALSATR